MKNGCDAMDCWIVDGMGLLCRFPMCGRVLSPTRWAVLARVSGREMNCSVSMVHIISVELETNLREVLLRAFSWLKAATTAFTSHLAPQPLPTSKHLFGVVYQQMVSADVRNARALPTSKMKVKVQLLSKHSSCQSIQAVIAL